MTPETLTYKLDLPHVFSSLDDLFNFINNSKEKSIKIDCSDIDILPTKCIQMLICAEQNWSSRGLAFEVTGLKPKCRENLSKIGLPETLFLEGTPK